MTEADRILCWQMARDLSIPDPHIEVLIGIICEDDEDAAYPTEFMFELCKLYVDRDPDLVATIRRVEGEQAFVATMPAWLRWIVERITKR